MFVPEQFFLFLQGVEHVDRGGLLKTVGLEGRQHVDKLQEDLSNVDGQKIVISLRSGHIRERGQANIQQMIQQKPSLFTLTGQDQIRGGVCVSPGQRPGRCCPGGVQ